VGEPRAIAGRRERRAALLVEFHRAVFRAIAQPRARVDDRPQPRVAGEVGAPLSRLVAVQDLQERAPLAAGHHGFDFARQRNGLGRRPPRKQSGVHHQRVALLHDERPPREPVDEALPIGRREHVVERVAAMRAAQARGDREQMEVVIAEHRSRGVAQRDHFAQHRERRRSAIDEVADEPQAVVARGERDEIEQPAKLGVTTLDVADRVVGHGRGKDSKSRAPSRLHARVAGC